jgi:hypothetical protein
MILWFCLYAGSVTLFGWNVSDSNGDEKSGGETAILDSRWPPLMSRTPLLAGKFVLAEASAKTLPATLRRPGTRATHKTRSFGSLRLRRR